MSGTEGLSVCFVSVKGECRCLLLQTCIHLSPFLCKCTHKRVFFSNEVENKAHKKEQHIYKGSRLYVIIY